MISIEFSYIAIAFILLLPFLYEFSDKFKLWTKFFLYYTITTLATIVYLPISVFNPGNPINALYATAPLRLVFEKLLGIHWEMQGQEHMTPERACVVLCNHQSSLDFAGMVYVWPLLRKITAIAKKELLYVFPFGICAGLCGVRYIDRSNPVKSKASMNAALDFVKKIKGKLWIFPEGTRSMKDDMLPFKKGAFHLAISGQLPILPIVFSSYKSFLNHKKGYFKTGNVIMKCLPPISTEGLTLEDMPKLMSDVRNVMMTAYTEISREVEQSEEASKLS